MHFRVHLLYKRRSVSVFAVHGTVRTGNFRQEFGSACAMFERSCAERCKHFGNLRCVLRRVVLRCVRHLSMGLVLLA